MTKTCKNCGHDKKYHLNDGYCIFPIYTGKCICKKFETEDNHTRQKNAAAQVTRPPAEDFDLSEKIDFYFQSNKDGIIHTKDVKTFIKKLKDNLSKMAKENYYLNDIQKDILFEEIDKLAGEKLR